MAMSSGQGYTPLHMFKMSEKFFTSMGLPAMPDTFWNRSMLVRPDDGRIVDCHPSAWDFGIDNDVRIKMCTEVNLNDFLVIHHEMGHIEYFLLYNNQSSMLRRAANNGFHEAIGSTMMLSVMTPSYLQKIKLLENVVDDYENDINFLMNAAIKEVVSLPSTYLADIWRWGVFSGDVMEGEYNRRWWDHRCYYEGISAPFRRTEDDLDPASIFHIAYNVPIMRYFVAKVLQFQFHKALCLANNHTGSLHKCDIYQSKEAGDILRSVMSLGASMPWPDVLEIITGEREMNAGPFLEYFQPLMDWLKKYNAAHNVTPGWNIDCPDMEEETDNMLHVCDSSAAMSVTSYWSIVMLLAAMLCLMHNRNN